MRKTVAVILAAVMALALGACGDVTAKKPDMYLEKANLTKQEQDLARLLGADNGQLIFDFVVDKNIKSVQVNTYRLADGDWIQDSGGGGQELTDQKGRLALEFDDLANGQRIALQSEHNSSATSFHTEPEESGKNMTRSTSVLDTTAEIVYEQEIPLAIQISTTKNEIRSFDVEYFFTPEEYAKQGYDQVFAVTILFSQKTVAELSR